MGWKKTYKEMNPSEKLIAVKIVHTLIWLFFVTAIFYILYSGISNKITLTTWIAIGLIIAEGVVLVMFRMFWPLTLIARKYSDSEKDNFDIYLPNWLARYNKIIFTTIYLVGVIIVIIRVMGVVWRNFGNVSSSTPLRKLCFI